MRVFWIHFDFFASCLLPALLPAIMDMVVLPVHSIACIKLCYIFMHDYGVFLSPLYLSCIRPLIYFDLIFRTYLHIHF